MTTITRTDTPAARITRVAHAARWVRRICERRGLANDAARGMALLTAMMCRNGSSPARAVTQSIAILNACLATNAAADVERAA